MATLSTSLRALPPCNYGIVKKAMLDYFLDLLNIPPSVVKDDVITLKHNPSK